MSVKSPQKPNLVLGLLGKQNRILTPRERNIKRALNHWQLYLMMIPAVAYVLIFGYKPMYGLLVAFKKFTFAGGITNSEWVGLDNFLRLFKSYWFPITLKNTLTISIISLVVTFPIPIIFALTLNEIKSNRTRGLVQTVSYAPHFISTVVICGMLLLFMSKDGLFNIIIKFFGGEPYAINGDPRAFPWIFNLSGLWQGLGWGSIIYYAALSGVDKSLLEAAELDGASRLQRIWHINIPVLIPTIVIQLILAVGGLMSVGHDKILLLQNQMNLSASEVISTYVYKVGLQQYDYAYSTANSIFNSVVNCIMLITVNTITKKLAKQSLW